MKSTTYPVQVAETTNGMGLFAAEEFEEGAVVEKLEGRVVKPDKLTDAQFEQAFEIDANRWVIATNQARHINHSCSPNCYVTDELEIVANRKIAKGEEITISYNEVTVGEYMKAGSILPVWNEKRNFKCRCGSRNCVGQIDRYIVPVPEDPNSQKVRVGIVEGRGRGMFATKPIKKGEVIERAPVVLMPGKQWKEIEDTTLIDYAFDWGEDGKEAVIAFGYISMYNHSYTPNAILDELFDELTIEIAALKDILPGEEIMVNYNGDPDNEEALWFTEGPGK